MTPESPPVPSAHPDGPLTGYRVLDLADEKGQLCARLLAELGADVIKIEPPREGDPTRNNGPFFKGEHGPNTSLYWWAMNAGKRSITLQLRLEAGRELLRRLIATSDIVIETNAPGDAAALGLDYASVSAANGNAGMPLMLDQPGVPLRTQVWKACRGSVFGAKRGAAPPWPTVPWHVKQPTRR